MKIYHSLAEVPRFGPCALTIGNFDGVHSATAAFSGGSSRWPMPAAGSPRCSPSIRILRAWWRRSARPAC